MSRLVRSRNQWFAALTLSRAQELDSVSTGKSVEISELSVYWENKVLIEAIENWLYKFELTGTP